MGNSLDRQEPIAIVIDSIGGRLKPYGYKRFTPYQLRKLYDVILGQFSEDSMISFHFVPKVSKTRFEVMLCDLEEALDAIDSVVEEV